MKIQSKPITVKVLQDMAYEDGFFGKGELRFKQAKNEYESAQIIITPDKDVEYFELTAAHLWSTDGLHQLPKDCFTVYFQKYIEVKELSPHSDQSLPTGFYPDALLPFDTAIKYKENRIKAGENQGVFVTLKTHEDQPAGEYRGEFTLVIDGEEYAVPVFATVWDFAVPREVHCQSDFVIGSNGLKLGENDYFPDMYRKYVEKMLEFRLAPHRVMQLMNLPYNEGADFVREVRYYTQPGKPYLSTIMLPVYPHPTTGIDEPVYKKFVLALAEAADEDKVDYFERAAVYCGFIDEPQHNGTWDETNRVCKRYEDLKNETADEFLANGEKTEFRLKIAESMRRVSNYVTIHFDERIKEVKSWCPGLTHMAKHEEREKYRKAALNGNNWWYTCGTGNDRPTLGIEDSVLDPRLMMWMTYDYGLRGTLFWETVQYFKWVFCLESHVNHEIQIDCYKEAVRCARDTGDGYLFYPGKPYGIYGPVESVRLHALRDGMEEFEYLYMLDEECKRLNRDFHEVTKPLLSRLYEDVTIKADAEVFDEVRTKIAELIVEMRKEKKAE